MAELQPLHIASTTPGMVWRISSYKPTGRPARVSAYEGTSSDGCWSCDLMGCRKFEREVSGRATALLVKAALCTLLAEMAEAGAIERKETGATVAAA